MDVSTMTSTLHPTDHGPAVAETPRPSRHRAGAPLLPPAVAYVALALAAAFLPAALAGMYPYGSGAALVDFYGHHQVAARLGAFLLLAAAVPFAVFAAVASSRLREAGLDVPGRLIALVGGTLGAGMLAVSGLAGLALTEPHVTAAVPVVEAVYGLAFAAGGPGFVAFAGLLLAGLAVPALVGRIVPRSLAWTGLGLAVVCEVGTLAVVTDVLDPLLPVARFGSMVWLVAVAVAMARVRTTRAR